MINNVNIEPNDGQDVFSRFPDFIREFIYKNSWDSLREVQIAAAKTIFQTNNHLLLTSSTASGKTEAVFFPILSELYETMQNSITVLYIAPLKSLINDQFFRIQELIEESGIVVTHWHGDVAASHKNKLLKTPTGVLQITPESLESMLINRSNDIVRLFCDLRYVIIDEIHTLTGADRGNQIICQLSRIERLIGHSVRRIGLSATVGNPEKAAMWLAGNSKIPVDIPLIERGKIKWRLGIEHFYIDDTNIDQTKTGQKTNAVAGIDAGYEYIYAAVCDRKSLVFSNSREETEYVTATLRQIAKMRGEPDIFLIHHGNLSASLREEAEAKMKNSDLLAVTCATVTMELGIDIGKLERIVHKGSPNSVSSFLQRLGRSGRRGDPSEMIMVFREENALPNTPLPQLFDWELLRGVAIIQLYIEESFIEPPMSKKMPLSLVFHQTLSILASSGELSVRKLAERILDLPPFSHITKEDYKTLLVSMIQNDFVELTDEKGLIVGLKGEKLLKSFKFYAVFKDSEDFTVRCGSDEIGTITTPPPCGDRFALAGRVWECEELDIARKLVYVKAVDGKMEIAWPGDFGEIHTKILERMKRVLIEDIEYPYLLPNARKRLDVMRTLARKTKVTEHSVISLGGYSWCMFPWLGTRSFRTLRKFMQKNSAILGISSIEFEGCYYLKFKMEGNSDYSLISSLNSIIDREGLDCYSLVAKGEIPVFDKYDEYIPTDLLRKAYATDKLRSDEVILRLKEILGGF